jgi:hypothetical protein
VTGNAKGDEWMRGRSNRDARASLFGLAGATGQRAHWFTREFVAATLIGMIVVAAWSLHLGQDLGPDFVNYHFWSAYIALHKGRLVTDIMPAGIQGYLNPYIYVPVYALYQWLPPRGVAIVIGAFHGLCLVAVYLVARVLLAHWPARDARIAAAGCAAFGIINPFFLAMAGSSFSDNLTPPLILVPLAVFLGLRYPGPDQIGHPFWHRFGILALAGAAVGAAVGFKLTNCAFVAGLGLAWFWRASRTRAWLWDTVATFGGIAAGFLLVSGEWMWRLWTEFQNPMFPFYNRIFKSPMIGEIWTNTPALAAAKGFYEIIVYPFRWMRGIPPQTEWNFLDLRYGILSLLVAALVAHGALRLYSVLSSSAFALRLMALRFATPAEAVPAYIRDRWWFLSLWVGVSYLFWIDQFGAMRYLMPVTLITGVLLVLPLALMIPWRRVALAVAAALAVVTLAKLERPDFGRVAWEQSWYPISIPQPLMASAGTLYLHQGLSFVLPFLPRDSRFIGFSHLLFTDGLSARARNIADAHLGPMRTLVLTSEPPSRRTTLQLEKLGLRVDPRDCLDFTGGVYRFRSCRVERITPSLAPISVPLPTVMTFRYTLPAWLEYASGLQAVEPPGVWTAGDTTVLHLAGELPSRFAVRITGTSFDKNGSLPYRLGVGGVEKEFRIQSLSHEAPETAVLPFRLKSGGARSITIRIPMPASPHSLDSRSGDMRLLGLFIRSIGIEDISQADWTTPLTIDLGAKAEAPKPALQGFSIQEPTGRWTEHALAKIDVLRPLPGKFTVMLRASAFASNAGQPLALVVGGKQFPYQLAGDMREISIAVTLGADNDDATVLEFPIPHPTSPAEIGISADPRKLGVFIERITIVPQP